jgi:crotonobetainyl-CoA:carnitine CoA-transferase CaiB-like acyl-CoA transferase
VDLTDAGAAIAGQMLSDLGADVVLVEPPEGVASRRLAPFADDEPGPERSLEFWSVHRGKRSLALDPSTESGREALRELARTADVWIDAWRPGEGAALGLDRAALAELNPGLVHVSITPFGGIGPKTHWAATDLTVTASSMTLWLTGDGDRAPLSCSVPQAFLHAGSEAATAALIALAERERSGLGQHIDVSAQASLMAATQGTVLSHGWNDVQLGRVAGGIRLMDFRIRFVYACADGYVNLTFLFGLPIGEATTRFFRWMYDEGGCSEALRDEDWVGYGAKLLGGAVTVEQHEETLEVIERFLRTKAKAELFAAAFEHRLLIVPLSDGMDLHRSKQLAEREFWVPLRHGELRRDVVYPGPFAKLSATPIRYRRPPPRLGEHTEEVLAERRPGVASSGAEGASGALPLEGLRVLDFTWVYAGPAVTRVMADYGATVIRVESSSAPDALRAGVPFKDGVPGSERSGNYTNVNVGKLNLGLNLKVPEARERQRKPDLVMLSSCLSGQTGPERLLAGYGTMGAALAGFGFVTGWPDRAPAAPFLAYTDYVSPRFSLAALLAALDHRRRTGEGQHIDCSQAECSIHMLGSAILEPGVNGRVVAARGNASEHYAPSGVYPTRGDDRWIALAAPDDTAWAALAEQAGLGWERDPRFAAGDDRLANAAALDEAISAWTAGQLLEALESALQARGVPAHRVSLSRDCFEDPQLAAREHFVTLDHAEVGAVPFEGSRMRFSRTPARVERAGPTLGQHNTEVLTEILGLTVDQVTELVIAGAIE